VNIDQRMEYFTEKKSVLDDKNPLPVTLNSNTIAG
jgi:hypothetical protein